MTETPSSQIAPPADELRRLLRRAAWPLGVLLVRDGVETRGATVSAFLVASLEPPIATIAVGRQRWVYEALRAGAPCSLNMLEAGQQHLADHFASRTARASGVMPVRIGTSPGGSPMLPESLLTLAGTVRDLVPAGDHSLVQLDVHEAIDGSDGDDADPLLWHHGTHAWLERAT